jgi:hypothetical protein
MPVRSRPRAAPTLARGDRPIRRRRASLALACALLAGASPALAAHDPNRTATIFVHGFELTGADRHGVFGDDFSDALAESVATMAGLPVPREPTGPMPINVVAGTTYYGDTTPPYYTDADRAELDRITAEWGGGVPRYAFIVARHARRVLERSGADQVNIVSVSFGSLITRWIIEKDVCGLAGEGRIARWLTAEGLIAGNWVASHADLVSLLSIVAPEPIDVDHMAYGWVETYLHAPRKVADDPRYATILIGQLASTDDGRNQAALRAAMLLYDEYMPNDGTQALPDAVFGEVAPASRFAGRMPTLSVFHADHVGIKSVRGAWARGATFVTASRRVTVTMTAARVANLREPQDPYWNWTPAEILFESRVYSPAALARWSITEPLSAWVKEGAAPPLRRYHTSGESQSFQQVLFDDLVLPEESALTLDLRATEVDYDPRYGVFETWQTPYYDDLGGGTLAVSALEPRSYTFAVPDWSCEIAVQVFDYAFAPLVGVPRPGPAGPASHGHLALAPNPARQEMRIDVRSAAPAATDEWATLEVTDLSGRTVRRMAGPLRAGFTWDGCDGQGRRLPAGVYLVRVVTAGGTWRGRGCLLR